MMASSAILRGCVNHADNGINDLFDEEETTLKNSLSFNPLRDRRLYQECLENEDRAT